MIDKNTLNSILYLSRLDVNETDKEHFQNQIGSILNYFDLLKNYDTSNINVDIGKSVNPEDLREDIIGKSFSEDEIEKFAIHFTDGFFSTPRILDDFLENKEEY